MDNNSNGNPYDVTPLQGANIQQTNSTQSNSQQSGDSQNINDSLSKLLNEIQNIGEEIVNGSRTNLQQQANNSSEQYPSSNSTGNSGTNENGNTNSSTYNRDAYEIEREIIRQVQTIKMNADKYGEPTDVVGRRAVLARSSNGRGNGYQFEYLLADGRIVSNDEAWELANAGKLRSIIGSHNKSRKYIRRVGDGVRANNLGNLPGF